MGDSLGWGDKLDTFFKWVDKASIVELKTWLAGIKGREWAYRDELPYVRSVLRERKNNLTQNDLEIAEIQKRLNSADKLHQKSREINKQAYALIVEATEICSHPPEKVIQWHYVNFHGNHENYYQCTQCGLREERTYYSRILPSPQGKDYGEVKYSDKPEEIDKTYSRTLTNKV